MISAALAELTTLPEAALDKAAPHDVLALYRRAFQTYGPVCFWSTREMTQPSLADALDAAARLKREGDMSARKLAGAIEVACRAAL